MTFTHLNDLLARFGDYPPERVRLRPAPGTATKQDVIDIEAAENRLCELIDGVLVEKAVGFREAFIASLLGRRLGNFAEQHDLGVVLGSDGTVELFPGQVRIPDVAFYPWDKLPNRQLPDDPIPGLHPDLAVEVISRTNTKGEMFQKLKDYFFAGVRLVWFIDHRDRTVEVYTAPDQLATLTDADPLTGGAVLPGFAVPVADLFASQG
jgi:Uma2 family endonuclease